MLALQNNGKHGTDNFSGINPMLQFLQQNKKKSFDTGKMTWPALLSCNKETGIILQKLHNKYITCLGVQKKSNELYDGLRLLEGLRNRRIFSCQKLKSDEIRVMSLHIHIFEAIKIT